MTENPIIQSDRIAFRPTADTDLDLVLRLERDKDNAPFIRQWSLERHRAAIADSNIAHLVVWTITDDRIIGYIILIGRENPDLNLEFKRIVIDDKGKGFGREAMILVEKYVFENLGVHRLWLEVMEHNRRAFELYKSVGFTIEGMHREAVKQGEEFTSLHVMSILAQEYKPEL